MKLHDLLLSGVLAFLAACCAVQAHPFPDKMTWIKHCDEIPDEATLTAGGTLTFLGTIECDTTKVRKRRTSSLNPSGEVIILSSSSRSSALEKFLGQKEEEEA